MPLQPVLAGPNIRINASRVLELRGMLVIMRNLSLAAEYLPLYQLASFAHTPPDPP